MGVAWLWTGDMPGARPTGRRGAEAPPEPEGLSQHVCMYIYIDTYLYIYI